MTTTETFQPAAAAGSAKAVPDEVIDQVMAGVDSGGLQLLGPDGVLAAAPGEPGHGHPPPSVVLIGRAPVRGGPVDAHRTATRGAGGGSTGAPAASRDIPARRGFAPDPPSGGGGSPPGPAPVPPAGLELPAPPGLSVMAVASALPFPSLPAGSPPWLSPPPRPAQLRRTPLWRRWRGRLQGDPSSSAWSSAQRQGPPRGARGRQGRPEARRDASVHAGPRMPVPSQLPSAGAWVPLRT